MQENGFKEETERTSKNNSVDEGLLKLSQGIKAIRKGLFEEGMSASNTYYLAFKKTNFTEEQASISPRVRMRECGSPSFSWEKIIKNTIPQFCIQQLRRITDREKATFLASKGRWNFR